MSFLERFRNHDRDELCVALQTLGIRAQMSERGRPEENFLSLGHQSLGVIEIVEGPIRWINVTDVPMVAFGYESDGWDRRLVYGVPDPKVHSGFPEMRLEAIDVMGAKPQAFLSKDLWDCIQSIARHLLAMPVPQNT